MSEVPRPPASDDDLPRFIDELGLPGIADIHVHFLPDRVQRKVWARFDALDPGWPVTYRTAEQERLATLGDLGVVAHTALAYAHRPGMAAWLNEHTLGLADAHDQVVPTFTFYPDDDVDRYVAAALDRGGRCAKVHLQVGKFDALDPRLEAVWRQLERRRIAVVLHAAAVPDGSGGERWCGVEKVAPLVERHPELPIVVAHAGAPEFADFVRLAEQAPSVHLDTAMVLTDPPYLGAFPADLVDRLLALHGRIAFGSDFPSIPHSYASQIRGLVVHGMDASLLREVLWETPRRLLGIAG
jgi:uncharacterized protein